MSDSAAAQSFLLGPICAPPGGDYKTVLLQMQGEREIAMQKDFKTLLLQEKRNAVQAFCLRTNLLG